MKALNALRGLSPEEVKLLFILGAGSFMLMSNLSSINVALPQIQDEFGGSLSSIKWVSITGFIVAASLSLCFGRIGDIYGRGSVYRAGIFVYAIGAGLCAIAPSLSFLIGFRVVMALGLAMASPLAAAIIAASVAPERRGQMMGLFASFAAAGQLMGPTLGGFVLDVASWRGIFVLNGSLAIALCVAQHLMLRTREERHPGSLDLPGALLLLLAYPALLIGLSIGPKTGWTADQTLLWFGLAGLGLVAFAWREATFTAPLVLFRLFRSPLFSLAMFLLAVTAFVQNPITLFAPIYLQKVLALNALDVGLIMIALPLSTLIAGPIGGRLSDRYPPRLVTTAGIVLLLVAVLAFSRLSIGTNALFVLIPLALTGAAGGLFRPANQVAVFATLDRRDYGGVSAIMTSLMMLAGTLGTTVSVTISESVAGGSDASSFVSGQQAMYLALLPLLIAGVLASLAGVAGRKGDEAPTSPVAEAPAKAV